MCFFTIIAAAAAVFGSGVRNSQQHDTRSSASVRMSRLRALERYYLQILTVSVDLIPFKSDRRI